MSDGRRNSAEKKDEVGESGTQRTPHAGNENLSENPDKKIRLVTI